MVTAPAGRERIFVRPDELALRIGVPGQAAKAGGRSGMLCIAQFWCIRHKMVPNPGGGSQMRYGPLGVRDRRAVVWPIWTTYRSRSGQSPESWPDLATAFLAGELPLAAAHATPALALRFMVDDLKAWYSEVAQRKGPMPCSRQVETWFWRQTLAGGLLRALRQVGMASPDRAIRTVAERFFVPAPYR